MLKNIDYFNLHHIPQEVSGPAQQKLVWYRSPDMAMSLGHTSQARDCFCGITWASVDTEIPFKEQQCLWFSIDGILIEAPHTCLEYKPSMHGLKPRIFPPLTKSYIKLYVENVTLMPIVKFSCVSGLKKVWTSFCYLPHVQGLWL